VLAFLSTGPIHPGHTLIIPKVHHDQIYQIPAETASALGVALTTVSNMVKKAVNADGINIHMNNEKAAGQAVFHAHVHIIPRYFGDGYKHWEPNYNYKDGEMAELAEKIRQSV
jgi:histidine triad (HIT) family protein